MALIFNKQSVAVEPVVVAPVVEVVQKTSFTPLVGHTSPETAYCVENYPYGFRLRCKIRYWLEYKPSNGFRLVSQTTNPKRAGEFWNKPKASTYMLLGLMVLDEKNYVTWIGCNMYEFDKLKEFEALYGASFDNTQRGVCVAAQVAYERYEALKAKRAAALIAA